MNSNSCTICCENYNRSTRILVCCPNKECNFNACKECVRTYLLSKTDSPHCMNCKQAWSYYFMALNLNKTFIENQYTKHREKLLMEREKSKMPDTMNAVDNFIQGEKMEGEAKEIDKELNVLRRKMMELNNQRRNKMIEAEALKNGKKVVTEKKKFIMPCPLDDCRGFLSSSYKCGACGNHACPRCLEVLGANPNHVQHTCDEDAVKTADLIKSTTKPCPKCGERISKMSGCDQMWCVTCHTAFSWKTGIIENGVIHNPHYYQYQRQANNGEAVRNPGDVLCGGLPNWFSIRRSMRQKWYENPQPAETSQGDLENFTKITQLFEKIHRQIAHITHSELPNVRHRVRQASDHRNLRIQYILNRIDEKKMSEIINVQDKQFMKDNELLHIYELISVVGIEMFAAIQNKIIPPDGIANAAVNEHTTTNEMTQFLKEKTCEFIEFLNYSNEQLRKISVSYSCRVPIIFIRLLTPHNNIRQYDCLIITEKTTLKCIKKVENNLHNDHKNIEWFSTPIGSPSPNI